MSFSSFLLGYLSVVVIWFWILKLNGAKWLEGSFLVGLILNPFAIEWTKKQIEFYMSLIMIIATIGFILGCIFGKQREYIFSILIK